MQFLQKQKKGSTNLNLLLTIDKARLARVDRIVYHANIYRSDVFRTAIARFLDALDKRRKPVPLGSIPVEEPNPLVHVGFRFEADQVIRFRKTAQDLRVSHRELLCHALDYLFADPEVAKLLCD